MKAFYKKILLLTIMVGAVSVMALSMSPSIDASGSEDFDQDSYSTTDYFDTRINVTLYHNNSNEINRIKDDIDDILRNVHRQATRYEDDHNDVSIKTINNNPGVWHDIDDTLYDLLVQSIDYYEETDAYFDISIGPIIDIWDDYHDRCVNDDVCEVPSDEELDDATQHTGIDRIELDHDNQRVRIEEGMSIDLGGVGKGYAAKQVGDYLKGEDEIKRFLINAGTSNIEVGGEHPMRESGYWHVGLTDPKYHFVGRSFASVRLTDGQNITTSGDYQRYYMADGERMHHLIDPNTNRPTDHHRSVSLISGDGALGDVLVTAIFLMDLEKGLDYVNNRDDLDAIWYIDGGPDAHHKFPEEGKGAYVQSDDVTLVMSEGFDENYLREVNFEIVESGTLDPNGDDNGSNPGDNIDENPNDDAPGDGMNDMTIILMSIGIPALLVIVGGGGYAIYIHKFKKQ